MDNRDNQQTPHRWFDRANARLAELNMQPSDLQDACGVSTPGVRNYLAGRRQPDPSQLKAIAVALKMSMDELMDMPDAARLNRGTAKAPAKPDPRTVPTAPIDIGLFKECRKVVRALRLKNQDDVIEAEIRLYNLSKATHSGSPMELVKELQHGASGRRKGLTHGSSKGRRTER